MQTQSAPPEALLDRFLNDCRAIGPVERAHRIGVAVSGGPDSLALLLLAHGTFGAQVEAATVDHGLRTESADEAAYVASLCRDLGIPHTTLRLPRRLPRGNVSARAREFRYALLNQWVAESGLDWLMTGHHADDQLETIVMRLNRGAGVGGLAAVRARNGRTLRPLLGWRHADLEALVVAAGYVAIDDPSNRDDRYDRARLRKMLAGADWFDPVAVNRAAAAFEDADTALAWSAHYWFKQRVTAQGETLVFDPTDLPAEIARRILLGSLIKLNPKAQCTGPKLTRLLEALRSGRKATLDGIACDARGDHWVMSRAPARRAAS